jgi:putative intracellular protease/amidase
MKIAFVLYPGFTALDLVGPYDVISRWPDADVHFLAASLDPVRTDRGLTVLPTATPATLTDPDMIVVPGSETPLPLLEDRPLIDWIRAAAPGCRWTVSVCTGAGLYAAAGLLEEKRTTTHWGFRDNLRAIGIEVVDDRVVFDGTHVSGAFRSAAALNAQAMRAQLGYAPARRLISPRRRAGPARPGAPPPRASPRRAFRRCCGCASRPSWG